MENRLSSVLGQKTAENEEKSLTVKDLMADIVNHIADVCDELGGDLSGCLLYIVTGSHCLFLHSIHAQAETLTMESLSEELAFRVATLRISLQLRAKQLNDLLDGYVAGISTVPGLDVVRSSRIAACKAEIGLLQDASAKEDNWFAGVVSRYSLQIPAQEQLALALGAFLDKPRLDRMTENSAELLLRQGKS